jgi:enterochelin esterase-like enzyme
MGALASHSIRPKLTGSRSRHPGIAALLAFTTLSVAGAGALTAPAVAVAGRVTEGSFRSGALAGVVHYSVYLPRGYRASTRHYPVVYVLHGLPAGSSAHRSIGWIARVLGQAGRRAIVIGAQGARSGDSDGEWHDWGRGRDWETATATELVRAVDGRYRTIRSRAGRVLIGFSAGGYGATLIGYHHPGTFSVIQSWSGYFEPTNPAGTAVLDLGSRSANALANMHSLVPTLRGRLGAYYRATYFSFYVGTRDHLFLQDNLQLHRETTAYKLPNVSFRVYDGDHGNSLWRTHAARWLSRALGQTGL